MAQVIEHSSSKHKALSSISNNAKKKKKKKKTLKIRIKEPVIAE
jgi:hypothetical protein